MYFYKIQYCSMTNIEKYDNAFVEALEVKLEEVKGLEYQQIENWDSVGHMSLIAAIEDAFNIMMETDDIIDFNSYNTGIDILKKYDIDMDK